MNSRSYRIGTRKSALARTQSQQILDQLEKLGMSSELVEIVSSGDRNTATPLYAIQSSEPGLFTKQLETALLDRRIDLAVHSLKDLPTKQPEELFVVAIPPRVMAEDCLVVRSPVAGEIGNLALKRGATVGTSSLRREAQLLSARPDLNVVSLRGNVPTRVEAVRSGQLDAAVLASAGLHRLSLDLGTLTQITLPVEKFVCAPGQGALALEIRNDAPAETQKILKVLDDEKSSQETRIERRILRALEGGCTLPLGVRCVVGEGTLKLWAFLGIARDMTPVQRDWLAFHHFDISEREEETLVAKTIAHFKPLLARR